MSSTAVARDAAPPVSSDAAYAQQVHAQVNGSGLPVAVCAPSSYDGGGGGTHAQLPTATPIMVQRPGMPGMVRTGQNMPMGPGNNQMPHAYPLQGSHYHEQGGQVVHVVMAPELTAQERRLMQPYTFGKFVRIFACIEIFFGILEAMKAPIKLLLVCMPIAGYYGAQRYETKLTRVYMLYEAIIAGYRVYDITQDFGGGSMLLNMLGILIALYIIRLVSTFNSLVEALDPEDLAFLRAQHLQMRAQRTASYW